MDNDSNQLHLGKVVSLSTANDTLAIENPQLSTQGGKLFVTGVIPKGSTNNDWAAGKNCGVSWGSVTDYIAFDSVEEYQTLLKKSLEE